MGLVQKLQGHICAFKSIRFKHGEEGLRLGSSSEKEIQSICITLLQGIGTQRGGSGLELIFRKNSKAHGCGEGLV